MTNSQDIWFQWLLERRHGGDEDQLREALDYLATIRDAILDKANLEGDETLLDVGCGDGLIAVEALQQLPNGQVIFSDISHDLLNHVEAIVSQMGQGDRSQFLCASAEDLTSLADESVDVVTHRSVLIYVSDKRAAFNEFYRVLKPGGRLSGFEPINRFGYKESDTKLWGFDITAVQAEAEKIRAVYRSLQPLDTDPMMNFDERDIIHLVNEAGFTKIGFRLEGEIEKRRLRPDPDTDIWHKISRIAGNPRIPTLLEAIEQALDKDEQARFIEHMRSETTNYFPSKQQALLYLWAEK